MSGGCVADESLSTKHQFFASTLQLEALNETLAHDSDTASSDASRAPMSPKLYKTSMSHIFAIATLVTLGMQGECA